MDEMLLYWLWLHKMYGGTVTLKKLIDRYGDPERVFRALTDGRELLGIVKNVNQEKLRSYTLEDAEETVGICRENGWRIITYGAPDYPARLRFIQDPPAVLFAEGKTEVLRNPYMFGVVGTRKPTDSGRTDAFRLGLYLSASSAAVVSGGADGIDFCAQEGGFLGPGGAIAVLGRGLGTKAPKNVGFNAARMKKYGVYLTELFPYTESRSFNFPKRNRLISGMSLAVAVIEAGEKSGALITAECANKQKRKVFVLSQEALPSPGCARLLANGALPFSTAGEILGCFQNEFPEWKCDPKLVDRPIRAEGLEGNMFLRPDLITQEEYNSYCTCDSAGVISGRENAIPEPFREPPAKKEESAVKKERPAVKRREPPEDLSENARKVYAVLTDEPEYTDDILAKCGLDPQELLSALTDLELEDLVRLHSGNRFSL